MIKINEEYENMNERQRAIYQILKTQVLGIEAARARGNDLSVLMHQNNLKEFIGEARKYGLDERIITKYEIILEGKE